jgi:hypothetical protein
MCNKMKFLEVDIAFVVLHFQTLNDTLECVRSIGKKIDTKIYKIIIMCLYKLMLKDDNG